MPHPAEEAGAGSLTVHAGRPVPGAQAPGSQGKPAEAGWGDAEPAPRHDGPRVAARARG